MKVFVLLIRGDSKRILNLVLALLLPALSTLLTFSHAYGAPDEAFFDLNAELHTAVQVGDVARAENALRLGGYLDQRDDHQRTPLSTSAALGASPEIVRLLVARGAQLDIADAAGKTPLHLAIESQGASAELISKILVDAGHSLNSTDRDGNTPLHSAAVHKRAGVVNLLLQAGADRGKKNKAGKTPLQLANTPEIKKALSAKEPVVGETPPQEKH